MVPHLAARMITGRSELAEICARLTGQGISRIFVPGGDADPAGDYPDALALLADLTELGRPFAHVGVTGYPESHPTIHDDLVVQAMWDKRRHATHVVSNLTFDPAVVRAWIRRMRDRGVTLPLLLGVPGPVERTKLLAMATRIGVGESTRFLTKHKGTLARLAAPGGFTGERFLRQCAPALAAPDANVGGLHVFTFNQIAETEAWRTRPAGPAARVSDPGPRPGPRRRLPRRPLPGRHEVLQGALEPLTPVSTTVSGRPIRSRRLRGQAAQLVVRLLGQPHHPGVVAEVGVAQLRPPVQPELPHDGAGEGPHQEVGEQVGAGLLVEQPLQARGAGVQVVAVQPGQPARGRARGTPRRGRRRCRSRRTPPRAGRTTAAAPRPARGPRRRSAGAGCAAAAAAGARRAASPGGPRSPPPAGRARRRPAARSAGRAAQKASCSTNLSLKSGRSESST